MHAPPTYHQEPAGYGYAQHQPHAAQHGYGYPQQPDAHNAGYAYDPDAQQQQQQQQQQQHQWGGSGMEDSAAQWGYGAQPYHQADPKGKY